MARPAWLPPPCWFWTLECVWSCLVLCLHITCHLDWREGSSCHSVPLASENNQRFAVAEDEHAPSGSGDPRIATLAFVAAVVLLLFLRLFGLVSSWLLLWQEGSLEAGDSAAKRAQLGSATSPFSSSSFALRSPLALSVRCLAPRRRLRRRRLRLRPIHSGEREIPLLSMMEGGVSTKTESVPREGEPRSGRRTPLCARIADAHRTHTHTRARAHEIERREEREN